MALDIQFLAIIAMTTAALAFLVKLMHNEATKPQWQQISSGVRDDRDKKEKA